jgi:hypothetical protein
VKLDISKFELQNMVVTATGLRTRKGLVSLKTPTATTTFVAAFSVRSPRTTDVWHYLFEQDAGNFVTLRVFTEEFFELYSLALGVMQKQPVITWAEAYRQLMINSPAFGTPLYGLVGGGTQTVAKKTSSINDDTTALDIPPGHIAAFGDRFGIAFNDIAFFNDPPNANGFDPRTFVAQSFVQPGGAIYDMFQGPDRGFYFFTSTGAYTLPQDALGQGQSAQGFLGNIPGIRTARPRNARASVAGVGVLQRDHLLVLPNERVPLFSTGMRRTLSAILEVEDLRQFGELFPNPHGFYVGFRGTRGVFADVDLVQKSVSWVTDSGGSALNLVGVLETRDNVPLPVTTSNVLAFHTRGSTDPWSGSSMNGIAIGPIPVAADDAPVIRRVTVAADNVGEGVSCAVDGDTDGDTTPTKAADNIIGTDTWGSKPLVGRATRSTRLSVRVRSTSPTLEVQVVGADRAVNASVDVELAGQGRKRRDKAS